MSKIPTRVLWRRTLLIYRSDWKQHFLTALPPAIFSVLIYVGGDALLHEVSRGYRLSARLDQQYWVLMARTLAVRVPEFGLPWILTTFAFAAVSSSVLAQRPSAGQQTLSDSYTAARERLGPIIRTGIVTFFAMVAGWLIAGMCSELIAFSPLLPTQNRGIVLGALLLVSLTLWSGLLSRTALSIPLLMDTDNEAGGAWSAIKKSVKISDGYEPFFILLVAQTLLLSVVGPWLGKQALIQLWRQGMLNGQAFEWLADALNGLIPAAVETFAFVGFTVLFMELRDAGQTALHEGESSEDAAALPISPR